MDEVSVFINTIFRERQLRFLHKTSEVYEHLLATVKNCSFPTNAPRGELSYVAPLGSENISAPYFKQCFKHHPSQSQDRNNKCFSLYIEFCINNKI